MRSRWPRDHHKTDLSHRFASSPREILRAPAHTSKSAPSVKPYPFQRLRFARALHYRFPRAPDPIRSQARYGQAVVEPLALARLAAAHLAVAGGGVGGCGFGGGGAGP